MLYACVQMHSSYDAKGNIIPAHRRSYRILPQLEGGNWSPYWESFQNKFSYPRKELDFGFERRFTRDEYAQILGKVAPKVLLEMEPSLMEEAFSKPDPNMLRPKYFFRYRAKGTGKEAVIYNRTHEWGLMEVGAFRHGIDAQEYVDFKNAL
jgi:hypothetical protein